MPFDENGVKWSCEPCIRGHRSSKCAHFDRLMVSVGKAGRPLSKCPHVEGSCNCKKLGAFMVAIPKGSNCLCRPVYKMLLDESGPTTAVSRLPLDTTTTPGAGSSSPSPTKIQKPLRKQIKTAPEQVTRALHSIPEYHQQALQFGTTPTMNPYTQAPAMGYPYGHVVGTVPHSNAFPGPSNFPTGMALPANGFSTGTMQMNTFQPPMQVEAPVPTQTQGSCCSSRRRESSHDLKTNPGIVAPNGYSVSPETVPAVAPASSSSTWPGFSSLDGHLSSVDATTNGYVPTSPAFAQQVPSNGYGSSASTNFAPPQMSHSGPVIAPNVTQHNFTTHTSGTPHNCNCGPNCNCFACPDHPYNDVTVQHVREMGRIIAGDVQALGDGSSQQAIESSGMPQLSSPIVEPKNKLEDIYDPNPAGPCCSTEDTHFDVDHDPEPLASFPSDHLMTPGAYYTYEYEIGLPGACAGEVGTCQCGPSCSCLGCLTHGNA
ncbi:hypothetical protein BDV19DRAFT_170744 [Aspergillus venezuelensis]